VKVDNLADAHRHHLKNSRVVNVNVDDSLVFLRTYVASKTGA
jgi:hypothetical protein